MSDLHDMQRLQTIIEMVIREKLPHIKSCALEALSK